MIQDLKNSSHGRPPIEIIEVTDPVENAAAQAMHEQFDRNRAWLQSHIQEVYTPENRGKIICIAGQELFIGDDTLEVVARATAAHPEDKGYFTRYIPREKMLRV